MGYGEQLAQQMGSQAASGIMGIVMGGLNDQRQIDQQIKLNELNKGMIDYNYQKQLQMWKDTSYSAQMEQMKKAGINPALMYGMNGGGGTTIGNATTGGGAEAPKGGGEQIAAQQMGIQYQLLQAQKENIQAQTEKTKGETANLPATGKNIEASTASLTQGIQNAKAFEAYTKAQTIMQDIQNDIQGMEANDIKASIRYGMRKLYAEMLSAEVTQNVDNATQNTKIAQAQATLANTVIDNYLKNAQISGIAQNVVESITKVKMMIQENMRAWNTLNQTDQQIGLQREKLEYDTTVPAELKEILDNIFIMPGGLPKKATPIGFKIQ